MSLNLPQSEVSVKGIKVAALTTSGLVSDKKPQGFVYQPMLEQRRIPGFDSDGNRTPGTPVVIGKDYRLQLSYAEFNPQIAFKLDDSDVGENYFDFAATFAKTDNTDFTFSFSEPSLVIDGNSISIDPLGNGMQISFTCTNPAEFSE